MTSNSVYMFGDLDIYDLEEYKKYIEKVKSMIESLGGDYLIYGVEIEALETKLWKPTRIVLIKLSNKKASMDLYNSEEYKPFKKIRFNTLTSNILKVEGIK